MENSHSTAPDPQGPEHQDLQATWLELMSGDDSDGDDQGLAPSVPPSGEAGRGMEISFDHIRGNDWDID